MVRTLFTGHHWFEATEAELKDWFGQEGPVVMIPICEDPDAVPGLQSAVHRADSGGPPGSQR